MKFPIEPTPRNKFRLDIVLGVLILITLILVIARVADKGTPSTRTNTWGIAVTLKSAVFLAYQLLTGHVKRFQRWASAKVDKILVMIDTVFYFALFIISIMGVKGAHSTSSKALGVIVVLLSIVLCFLDCIQCYICIVIRKDEKRYGRTPTARSTKSSTSGV
ncbi:hypothetical protein PDE_05684 [Penicillium oxalicum 114-2]|uniref:Uncharacterized protein n=1 Tax=Penicillium oxalicum (strain 114-2 / CGMCC 5302) TaxID=933388 RepID=S8B7M9_PENO1|nr:hypothetical protein PDE_05684 [Penicillium oxalicum 114-2]